MDRLIADQAILLSGASAGPSARRRRESPGQRRGERHTQEPEPPVPSAAESAFDAFITGVAESLTLPTARTPNIRTRRKPRARKQSQEPPLDSMIADTADLLSKGSAQPPPRDATTNDLPI